MWKLCTLFALKNTIRKSIFKNQHLLCKLIWWVLDLVLMLSEDFSVFQTFKLFFFKVLNILNLMYFILLPCNLKQGPWFVSVKFSL